MCGLAGIFSARERHGEALTHAVDRMSGALVHRGPDDSGTWTAADAGVALGFRRLAIIDLSPLGHQPMSSAGGRFTMVFNGEIYNYQTLRRELEETGVRFRGHSDTEVTLAAFERWGIAPALSRLVGMFAMAIWDARERSLTLARDRMGKKPLFVYREPGLVTFASELKALRRGPAFDDTLDLTALSQYLQYLYVPGPRSIFARVRKLEPGHLLTITDPRAPLPDAQPYWTLEGAANAGRAHRFDGDPKDAVEELDALLRDAVRSRMYSDVPLGAFLSGGIDSSTVVALMQAQSPRPVRTFSIAFDDARHDESPFAEQVAAHLGTDHTTMMVTGADALAVVDRLPDVYDEPFADASQIPTYLVSQLARRHVTVALSGDGGDEVFAGYNRYLYSDRMIAHSRRLPRPARQLVAAGISSLGTDGWNRAYGMVAPMMPRRMRHRLPGEKLYKLRGMLLEETDAARYRSLVCLWPDAVRLVPGAARDGDPIEQAIGTLVGADLTDRLLFADQSTYLIENQMTKVDRASMANSLEVRAPLMDHRVTEFSWRLPIDLKIRGQESKWVLRQVLYRYVPRSLVERPKMGFSVPLGPWLRGPLRDWAESLLAGDTLARGGVLQAAPIRDAWRRCLAGTDDGALGLWAVLMFQSWRARWSAA